MGTTSFISMISLLKSSLKEELCAGGDNSWKAHGKRCFRFLVQHEGWAFSTDKDSSILAAGL